MAVAAEHLSPAPEDERDEFDELLTTRRDLDAPDGYKLEIFEGAIVMNPPPSGRHSELTAILYELLLPDRPSGTRLYHTVSVRIDESSSLFIPDMSIAYVGSVQDVDSIVDAAKLLIVIEVTSRSNARIDREVKRGSYANSGIAKYLLIDRVRKNPTVTLHTDPVDGEYQHVVKVPFGDSIHIPAPFDFDLDTSQFPR